MQTDIALHRQQESLVKLLLLKSGFILPPVYQPDCSSDPWRWSPLLDVYVLVLLTGDRGKTKLKNITSQRGEGESLVLSWVRLDLNWVFIILCNFILFFLLHYIYHAAFITSYSLQATQCKPCIPKSGDLDFEFLWQMEGLQCRLKVWKEYFHSFLWMLLLLFFTCKHQLYISCWKNEQMVAWPHLTY